MENEETPEKEHDPYFEPIISLPEVKIPTLEENENILICQRGKLYRMDTETKEWKERGTGEVKILHDPLKKTVRIVMRRDKTLKICANHYITKSMTLKPNNKSDRAWVWTTLADFADETPKSEILAIMFLNSEYAKKWKVAFMDAKALIFNDTRETETDDVEESKSHECSGSCSSSDSLSDEENDKTSNHETPESTINPNEDDLSEEMKKKLNVSSIPDIIKDL